MPTVIYYDIGLYTDIFWKHIVT